jgi:hypothetical protein
MKKVAKNIILIILSLIALILALSILLMAVQILSEDKFDSFVFGEIIGIILFSIGDYYLIRYVIKTFRKLKNK